MRSVLCRSRYRDRGAGPPGSPVVAIASSFIPERRVEVTRGGHLRARTVIEAGRLPVAAFVGRSMFRVGHGRPTALQGIRRPTGRSYSPHTPGLGSCFPVPSGSRASPRRIARPSQVSGLLWPAGHVARSIDAPRPSRMSGCHPGIVASRPHRDGAQPEFSPSRTQKLSGTHLDGLFAVRHRLRPGLTGKRFVFAPLVVELFPAAFFRAVPGPRVRPGPSDRSDRKSPRQPRCMRIFSAHPAGGILTRFAPPRPHSFEEAFPCRPRSNLLLGGYSIGSNARFVSASSEANFVRASLRRTGRAPLDASGSTGRHLAVSVAGDEPTCGRRPVSMTSADASRTSAQSSLGIVAGNLGSAQREVSLIHRFSAATRVESVARRKCDGTPSQSRFSFRVREKVDIKKAKRVAG